MKKKDGKFGCSYVGNGCCDFLQIWNVNSPNWQATLQQMWFQSEKGSPRYKGVKITFSFFLSVYPQCGAPASGPHDTLSCVLIYSTHQVVENAHQYEIFIISL